MVFIRRAARTGLLAVDDGYSLPPYGMRASCIAEAYLNSALDEHVVMHTRQNNGPRLFLPPQMERAMSASRSVCPVMERAARERDALAHAGGLRRDLFATRLPTDTTAFHARPRESGNSVY
jgi:hypothetical protein